MMRGRPVVTLDTRNAFEVDQGTFDNAIDWRIDKFTEFPQLVKDGAKMPLWIKRGQMLVRDSVLPMIRYPSGSKTSAILLNNFLRSSRC